MRSSSRFVPVLSCALLVSAACQNLDVVTETYSTMAEARQAGAVDRGWIPEFVPPGAHDLRDAHDLDTSRQWGLFDFSESDDAALRAGLHGEETSVDGHTCDVPRRIEWWPVMLRGRLNAEQIRSTGLVTYLSRRRDLVVAVNWKQRRAYYWTNSS